METIDRDTFKGRSYNVRLTAMDVCVLLHNLVVGANQDDVGFEDANQTLDEVIRYWNKPIWWERNKLESALWSCNMMHEAGKFWHPYGWSFDRWMRKIDLDRIYNKKYNFLKDRED